MRKWLITIGCIGMLLLFPICAFAHSGRTDGSGGHYDGDDYHYHHGYPAHDHRDMDGDGDVDCPYLFDDKTGQNSGGAGNSKQDQGSSQNQGNSSVTGDSSASNGIHPLWVAIILALFVLQVIYTVHKARECIVDDKSLSSKICTGVAFGVCLCLIVYNSLQIVPPDAWQLRFLNGDSFDFSSLIGLAFVWYAFMLLLGAGLAAIQLVVLLISHYKKVGSFGRFPMLPGSGAAVFTSINAMGIFAAYNLMLYTFGMSDWLIVGFFS